MGWVFLAVHNEVVRVATNLVAKFTPHGVQSILRVNLVVAPATSLVASLLLLSALEIQLLLKLECFLVARLPKATIPLFSNAVREQEEYLRNVSQVVLIGLNDADDVTLATFTEGKGLIEFIFSTQRALFFVDLHVELDEFFIFAVLFSESLGALYLLKCAKNTLCKVEIVRHVVKSLQRSQVRLAPIANHHDVSQRNFLALQFHLVN